MDDQIFQLIKEGNYSKATLLLERESINNSDSILDIVNEIPISYIKASPTLMFLLSTHWIDTDKLFEAENLLNEALRKFAELSMHTGFLNTLALLSQTHIKLGNKEQAKYYLNYLQEEYSRAEYPIGGVVPFTLALGRTFIESGTKEGYLYDAFKLYKESQDVKGMAVTLVEIVISLNQRPPLLDQMLMTFDEMVRDKEHLVDYSLMVKVIVLYHNQQWDEAHLMLGRIQLQAIPMYYRRLCSIIKLIIEKRIVDSTADCMKTDIDNLSSDFLSATYRYLMSNGTEISLDDLHSLYNESPLPLHKKLLEILESGNDQKINTKEISVFCFNGFKLKLNNQSEYASIHWERKRAQDIFIYLLLQNNYRVNKEKLIEQLFPHHSPKKADTYLRVLIHYLNHVFHEHFSINSMVQTRDGNIFLNEQIYIRFDVTDYSNLIKAGERHWAYQSFDQSLIFYMKASEMYGLFMDGYEYQDWIEEVRSDIQQKQVHILRRIAQYSIDREELSKAEYYLNEAISIDSTNEELYHELISILHMQNKKNEINQCMQRLRAMLRTEYDLQEDEIRARTQIEM